MATVYILFSEKLNKHYIGSCKNLDERLVKHKEKEYINSFTSNTNDWKLCFQVQDLDYQQARKIESHIKSMKSKIYIQNLMKYPEMIIKLIGKFNNEGSSR